MNLPEGHSFAHEAMNTTFRLRLCGCAETLARDVARECFDHLELLESKLSRFIESSDVSRINQLRAGETLYISGECHQCLLAALDGNVRTGGLFDISLGRRIEHLKTGETGPPPPLEGKLTIHPDIPAVTCGEPGREIDLGGIGKGFALDQLQQILSDWGVEGGLLAAGASSLLAFGPEPWPVDLAGTACSVRITLHNGALSASGTTIQGSHIVHPAGDAAMPAARCQRLWAAAPTAVLAEVWSTALMLVEPAEIPVIAASDDALQSVHVDVDGVVSAAYQKP